MTGLILKDFLILRKALRSYLLIAVIYMGVALTGAWPVTIVGGLMVAMIAILPMNVFAYDKQARWDTYGLALPVGRTRTVAARYLCVLLLCLFSLILTVVCGAAMLLLGRIEEPDTYIVSCAACGLLAVLVNTVMLPLLYKFGPERARLFFYGFMGFVVAVVVLFFKVFGGAEWLESLGQPTPAQIAAIPFIAAFAGLALLAASFLLSRHFYSNQDV